MGGGIAPVGAPPRSPRLGVKSAAFGEGSFEETTGGDRCDDGKEGVPPIEPGLSCALAALRCFGRASLYCEASSASVPLIASGGGNCRFPSGPRGDRPGRADGRSLSKPPNGGRGEGDDIIARSDSSSSGSSMGSAMPSRIAASAASKSTRYPVPEGVSSAESAMGERATSRLDEPPGDGCAEGAPTVEADALFATDECSWSTASCMASRERARNNPTSAFIAG
mmetsp:Transcript_10006/g.30733  ORF Transcript_10006/g.30733 Transcript_10006/m.30733 type:complete len:224 (+) Transcript_10006:1382-2053(+)|eukprot:scaffold35328_cov30-Tisochrysis_lutea.AAC.3